MKAPKKKNKIDELKKRPSPTKWLKEVTRETHHVFKTKKNDYWKSSKYWKSHGGQAPSNFLKIAMTFQSLGKNEALRNIKSENEKERVWGNYVSRIESLRKSIMSKAKTHKKTK